MQEERLGARNPCVWVQISPKVTYFQAGAGACPIAAGAVWSQGQHAMVVALSKGSWQVVTEVTALVAQFHDLFAVSLVHVTTLPFNAPSQSFLSKLATTASVCKSSPIHAEMSAAMHILIQQVDAQSPSCRPCQWAEDALQPQKQASGRVKVNNFFLKGPV